MTGCISSTVQFNIFSTYAGPVEFPSKFDRISVFE